MLIMGNNQGECTYLFTYTPLARQMSFTLGFYDPTTILPSAAGGANLFRTELIGAGMPYQANQMMTDWVFNGCKVLMRDNSGNLVSGTSLVNTQGTAVSSTNVTPIYTPYVISKTTAQAGKKFRGRLYAPVTLLQEGSVDAGGGITTGHQTGQQTLWTAFWGVRDSSGIPPYLLHDASTPGPSAATHIIGFFVRPVLGVQRRRRTRGA